MINIEVVIINLVLGFLTFNSKKRDITVNSIKIYCPNVLGLSNPAVNLLPNLSSSKSNIH